MVDAEGTVTRVEADTIVLSTGSRPRIPEFARTREYYSAAWPVGVRRRWFYVRVIYLHRLWTSISVWVRMSRINRGSWRPAQMPI